MTTARLRIAAIVIVALAAIGAAGWALLDLGGDDADPVNAGPSAEPSATVSSSPSASPSPKASPTPTCEGPTTQFNLEGRDQDSLLPDCGTKVVTRAEQKKSGLGLGCGGTYPVILYKTTTSGARTSICGKDATGETFRFVTQANGGEVIDMKGDYNPGADSFVAKKDGVRYEVQAYDGTLVVTRDGRTTTQKSSEWISLDNESDYD
ncbi:hypothetical protein [Aeromicrobium terrae]|uniref:Uncharacterized protein n=1 Tax=Aeromicrobium terrae TaxID=2498846 RepID=A0A5C8NGI8_9ACTN|nr:hypothetical protein [Aeromicrobium terrae]TXL57246.1 hypothetical protein FHP06_14465 [Aeromicrobium terrae]